MLCPWTWQRWRRAVASPGPEGEAPLKKSLSLDEIRTFAFKNVIKKGKVLKIKPSTAINRPL